MVAIDRCMRSHLKMRNSSVSVSFLAPIVIIDVKTRSWGVYMVVLTFGYWEEPDQNQCVLVRASNVVLNVSDREV
jgi:hypothetical protein